jgi:hypothetical protein
VDSLHFKHQPTKMAGGYDHDERTGDEILPQRPRASHEAVGIERCQSGDLRFLHLGEVTLASDTHVARTVDGWSGYHDQSQP